MAIDTVIIDTIIISIIITVAIVAITTIISITATVIVMTQAASSDTIIHTSWIHPLLTSAVHTLASTLI